ncbi:MAG: hypothetical protein ACP5RS_07145 [Thermoplasmata archaeon]
MRHTNVNECPSCHKQMKKGMAPFHFHGKYIGLFEAYICDYCHRKFFTDGAYYEIMKFPTSLDDFSDFIDQKPIHNIDE